ncbi:MAG: putative Ig domain-containing protein, partial [Kangiellaceae bacterium]|nr:putative Ig domain-containing protein [Kangiellaceae bacterium]
MRQNLFQFLGLVVSLFAGVLFSQPVQADYAICLSKEVSNDANTWHAADSEASALDITGSSVHFKFVVFKCPNKPGGLKNIQLTDSLLNVSESLGTLPHSETEYPEIIHTVESTDFCNGVNGVKQNTASVVADIVTLTEQRSANDSAWVNCNSSANSPVISIIEGAGPYPSGVNDAELIIATDVEAECRGYDRDHGDFDTWSDVFSSDDNLNHRLVTSISGDYNQNRYIRCRNLSTGTTNTTSTVFPVYFYKSSVLSKTLNLVADKPMNNDGNFTLTWDTVAGATSYVMLERKNNQYWKTIALESGLTSIALSRPEYARYQYRVSACIDDTGENCGVFSDEAIVSIGSDPAHFPPEITIVSGSGPYPPSARNMDLIISTNLDAECRHSESDSGHFQYWGNILETTDNRTHRLSTSVDSAYNQDKVIRCKALATGYYHEYSFEFPIYFQDYDLIAPPANFIADKPMNYDGQFTLSWDSVDGANRYHIMEKFNAENWRPVELVSNQNYITLERPQLGRYEYRIASCTDGQAQNCGEFSDETIVSVGAEENHFPPVVSLVSTMEPYPYGTTHLTAVISTNVDAECKFRYADYSTYDYWSNLATTEDNRTHTAELIINGTYDQTNYFRCKALDTGYTNKTGLPVTANIVTKDDLLLPTGFTLTHSDNQGNVSFAWDTVDKAFGYRIRHEINYGPYVYHFFDESVTTGSIKLTESGNHQFYLSACGNNQGNECTNKVGPIRLDITLNANQAPTITTTPDPDAVVSQQYIYDVDASDPEGDSLAYSLNAAPNGMTIDSVSGVINWTPVSNQVGSQNVTVVVTDSVGNTGSQSFVIEVDNAINNPPVITSQPVTSVQAAQTYSYQLVVNEPEGEPVTYTLTSSPDGMGVSSTGLITWSPSEAQVGSYSVSVSVSDPQAQTATQSFTLIVSPIPNRQPVANSANVSTGEDSSVVIVLSGSDQDNDPLTYELVSQPSNGVLSGTAPSLIYAPNENYFGNDSFTFRVNDGELNSGEATVSITVGSVNDAPVITSFPITIATQDFGYFYQVMVNDIEGDAIIYQLEQGPTGMQIGLTSGTLTWTPTENDIGSHSVAIIASDNNGGTDRQDYLIIVSGRPNNTPVITSEPVLNGAVNEAYSYSVIAEDLDNDPLSYSVTSGPTGLSVGVFSGVIDWIPEASQIGESTVTVKVEDGKGGSTTQSFKINVVIGENQLPQITSSPVTNGAPEKLYSYQVLATDADGDVLEYVLTAAPQGMLIDKDSGLINWVPEAGAEGTHQVSVRVFDPKRTFDEQVFNIELIAQQNNQAPVIVSTPVISATVLQVYNYELEATDPEAEPLHYELAVSPKSASINDNNGGIAWVADSVLPNYSLSPIEQCSANATSLQLTQPEIKWEWSGGNYLPNFNQVIMTPVVANVTDDNGDGNINSDDIPDVIFLSYDQSNGSTAEGILRVISGSDGTDIFTVDDVRFAGFYNLSVADIDGDGIVEIVAPGFDQGLYVYEHTGELKWSYSGLTPAWAGAISISDINADDSPEIIIDQHVLSSNGELLWSTTGWSGEPLNRDGIPSVVDLNDDNFQEIIWGASAYSHLGELLWENASVGNGFSGVGNFDTDNEPEIVVVSGSQVN